MIFERITKKVPIEKGWSGDRKYRVTTADGQSYLLRVSPPEKEERVKQQFARMQSVAALGIPMCLPLEWGLCKEGPYMIQSWIEGEDAEAVLPGLPRPRQYAYGLDAGRILKKIHALPAPEGAES